jgi:hypothetical protein
MKRSTRFLHLWSCLILLSMAACQSTPPTPAETSTPERFTPTPAGTTGMDLNAIHSTPTSLMDLATQGISSTPEAVSLPGLPAAGKMILPGHEIAALAIDEKTVYWVPAADLRHIYRAPLSAADHSQPEMVVQSRYITGTLAAMPIQAQADELVFLDEAFNANNPVWVLRAYNLVTHQEKVLSQAGGDYLAHIYGFTTDGAQAAWIFQDFIPTRSCREESVLTVANLSTGKAAELDRSCATKDRQWNSAVVSGSRVIASATALTDGNPSTIYLWNTLDGKPQPISTAFPTDRPSSPALGADWAAWQTGPGEIRSERLSDGKSQILTSPVQSDQLAVPAIQGGWLTWQATPDVLVYRLEPSTWFLAAAPGPGERITQVAIGGGWIAWCRETTAGDSKNSQIEWAKLD